MSLCEVRLLSGSVDVNLVELKGARVVGISQDIEPEITRFLTGRRSIGQGRLKISLDVLWLDVLGDLDNDHLIPSVVA